MKFESIGVYQACVVKIERHADSRGFFARTFCEQEFAAAGLPSRMVQASISFNAKRGTVRGMHFQWPPSCEGKLVRCLRGAVFDVLLDLRPESPTYLRHVSVDLDEHGRDAVFVPHGVAHGFETLTDAAEVLYEMTDTYVPELATGVRWDDPSFGIEWPIRHGIVISPRDAQYPDFDRLAFESERQRRTTAGVCEHP